MTQSLDRLLAQAKLRYQDRTKQDIQGALQPYRSLSPKLETFVFNDGAEKQMLCLDGTIPVIYKGSTYNIPICIWILDNHPLSSPMVYVKPTFDMLIKASRHVDQTGKVYLPYLHEWNPNSSDLYGLIQILIMTFAEMPPVYSKPRSASPAHFGTPYPVQQQQQSMPMPGGPSPLPYPTGPPTTGVNPPPPYPAYPTPPNQSTPYPVYPPSSTPGYPTSNPPYPSAAPGGYPPYPSAGPTFEQTAATTTASTGTITEEHIRASLLSAVSDKVREKLRDVYGCAQAEVSVLRQQQHDLQQGATKLDSLMQKMEQEQNELEKSIHHLREKEAELKGILDKTKEDTDPMDIDEAVTTTAPLFKQLLNCYAEDQATQDAIYYLGEALRSDVIDLETYLKHVRSLSRKQFHLRATMSKCRSRAHLAG